MIAVLLLIAGLGVLLGLALAAWSRRRSAPRQRPRARGPQPPAAEAPVPVPYLRTEAAPAPMPPPDACERRLFALAAPAAGAPLAAGDEALLAEVRATLDDPAGSAGRMPRRPQLLPQLMQTLNDPAADSTAIAALIARDPALSVNLLRIANSPLYRLQSLPVESVERAVTILGTDGIRQIIATALLQPMLGGSGGTFGPLPALVWEHAQLAAVAAAEHARRQSRNDAFAGQLLGLLRGLGAMTVVQALRDAGERQPGPAPSAAAAARLVHERADATARRIAAEWELSERILAALDEQGAASPRTPLGRALRYGRHAAALALLARQGALPAEQARAQLAEVEADARLDDAVWQRLTAA